MIVFHHSTEKDLALFLEEFSHNLLNLERETLQGYQIQSEVFGRIQGVGFRPFVAGLAAQLNLCGSVANRSDCAVITLNLWHDGGSTIDSVLLFYTALFLACGYDVGEFYESKIHNTAKLSHLIIQAKVLLQKLHLPQQAYIQTLRFTLTPSAQQEQTFCILPSLTTNHNSIRTHIPLDTKICDSCLQDMRDSHSRFHNYPFTACINCGARYSILRQFPYDRANTSMENLPLCDSCQSDYSTLTNRRFHTQPISCPTCAISVCFYTLNESGMNSSPRIYDNKAIQALAKALVANRVILYKGLGGFAYIANANNTESINQIRTIKSRQHKPFVVMAGLETLRNIALLTPELESALQSKHAPIILAPKHPNYSLSESVCTLHTIGVMIPYTAMLELLFSYLPKDFALIYTSANNKGEMIASNLHELRFESIFKHIPNLCVLEYNREILHRVDDSILLGIDSSAQDLETMPFGLRSMRLSRGFAPLHITRPQIHWRERCAAFGAMQKSSLAFAHEDSMVVSPYMGDLFSLANIANFRHTFDFFCALYGMPQALAADKHTQYASTQIAQEIARNLGIPLFHVAHHHAHFNALLLESGLSEGVGILFDGSGLGDDGTLWGGEFFSGNYRSAARKIFFKPFRILGGENHIRDSKRLAYSYALSNGLPMLQSYVANLYTPQECQVIESMYRAKMNAPMSSSVGRLFDIAGFILGLHSLEYEGQSGEMIASLVLGMARQDCSHYDSVIQNMMNLAYQPYPFHIENGMIDISACMEAMLKDTLHGCDKGVIALRFIDTLACCILEALRIIGTDLGLFGGGVFANYALCMRTKMLLHKEKIHTFFPQLPCNDYSISIGQLAFLAHTM